MREKNLKIFDSKAKLSQYHVFGYWTMRLKTDEKQIEIASFIQYILENLQLFIDLPFSC